MNPLLRPFGRIYGAIMALRNQAFDIALLKAHRPSQWVVSLGNLSTGGTGKTPHAMMIAGLLQKQGPTAVLSRGYGRTTKGYRELKQTDKPELVGDEPLLIKHRMPELKVVVCEDRSEGARRIGQEHPDVQSIVLDDAFQHRYIHRDLNILLTRFDRPFYKDQLLPEGQLRESRKGADRADLLIVTHCPADLDLQSAEKIQHRVKRYSSLPVFFTTMAVTGLFNESGVPVDSVDLALAVAGIAQPKSFFDSLKKRLNGDQLATMVFPDHHRFSQADIARIRQKCRQNGHCIITTEKDRMRWPQELLQESNITLLTLRIEVEFLFGKRVEFEALLFRKFALGSHS